jgi:hypothetical protein
MSIIITSIDHLTRVVYMAADHRSLDLDKNYISDNNTKIFNISDGILYGMSGLTTECLRMKDFLEDNRYSPASKLIQLAESFIVKNIVHNEKTVGSTFVLAGIYDDGKPFVWSKSTYEDGAGCLENKVGNLVRLPSILVSAPNQSTADAIMPLFMEYVIKTNSYSEAILLLVKEASKLDKAVSPSFDLHMFDTATMTGITKRINIKNVEPKEKLYQGGFIRTELLDVDLIVAKNLVTGKVKITAANNNIVIENEDGEVIIEIDDDNAVEGETVSTIPPVTYNGQFPKDYLYHENIDEVNYYHSAILGPGISVGISPTHPDGFSTMSRKGIFTNGNIQAGGNSKSMIMDHNGFETNSGKRTVSGEFDMPIPGTDQFIQRTTIENGLTVGSVALSVVNLPAAKPITTDNPTALKL